MNVFESSNYGILVSQKSRSLLRKPHCFVTSGFRNTLQLERNWNAIGTPFTDIVATVF